MSPALIGFLIYLVVVLAVGLWSLRRMRSMDDYLLGGRRLGPFVVSLSERASGESAWLVLGLPGAALAVGLVEAWTAIGCVTGIAASWYLVARRLREASGESGALTLPELVERRVTGSSPQLAAALRISASLIITFFFVFYVSAQFLGAGKVLHQTLGLGTLQGMLLGALLIVLYTLLGGFLAVAWTDVIQGLIMFATLVILPLAGLIELGGFTALREGLATARATEGHLLTNLAAGKTGFAAFSAVVGGLSWGLGYLGQPHLLVRYMSIRDAAELPLGRRIALAWALPAFAGALLLGLVGAVLIGMPPGGDPEQIMPLMATTLLPAWLAGIFMSGAIAAMMSTADSQLLVASSSLVEDLLKDHLPPAWATPGRLLLLGRLATLLVGLLAFALALSSDTLVYKMVAFAWAGLGASFGPLLLFILFRLPVRAEAALAAMWVGCLSTVVWKLSPALGLLVTERVSSFVLATLVLVLLVPWSRSRRSAAA